MQSELLSPNLLAEVRNAVYSGDGYYVLRQFISPEHGLYIVQHWRKNKNVVCFGEFKKSKLFFDGCPNYSIFPDGRQAHFNFFWNSPNDSLTYDSAWRIQRLRNQVEGNPASDNYLPLSNANLPLQGMSDDWSSAVSFRVVGTTAGGGIELHKDWEHDPAKVQMSLVLSSFGLDYGRGGFLFRKRDGSIVNLSRELNLRSGDLLIFRYCMEHGVEPVMSDADQIGFWRLLFPVEAVRSKRGLGTSKPYRQDWKFRRWAGRVLRRIRKVESGDQVSEIDKIQSNETLLPMTEIAIQSGVSPSEVFFKKGLFARWEVMQRWQFESLLSMGLQPHHRFLDIGCGVFRLGMRLLPYLESNCYFGTDPVPAYLETSKRYASSVLKSDKHFELLLDHAFEFERFGVKFDFAMAHSVFTHMSTSEIEACLRRLALVMKPGGKLLFTIALDSKLEGDFQEAFVYNAQIPMVRSYHASDGFYRTLSEEIGFTLEPMVSPKHPSQSAFVATFID